MKIIEQIAQYQKTDFDWQGELGGRMGILEKIAEIQKEMARTQKNKVYTSSFSALSVLKCSFFRPHKGH